MPAQSTTTSTRTLLTMNALRAAALVAAVACGDGSGGGSNPPTAPAPPAPPAPTPATPVASVEISPTSATLVAGDTVRFKAVARDAAGRELTGVTFTWASSHDAMARVAPNGLVTALAVGEVRISVSAEAKQAEAQVAATARTFAHGTIAFISDRHGTPEIYVIGPEGERRVTNNAISETRFAWSPDGTRIALENSPLTGQQTRSLWVINADGSGETRLTNPPESSIDLDPQWASDGRRVAFWRTGSQGAEIRIVNADGTSDVRLAGGSGFSALAPSWSPDGSRITFFGFPHPPGPGTDASDIYVVNADGTGLKNLTNTPRVSDERPRWSPDGRKIAFDVWLDGTGPQVHTINPDGSGFVRLTTAQWFDRGPIWSHDSKRIAFRSNRDRAGGDFYEVYVMNADGSAQTRLTTGRWFGFGTSWSPDDSRIAFAAQLENPGWTELAKRWDLWHVYVVNADGTGLVRVTGAGTSEHSPAWKP